MVIVVMGPAGSGKSTVGRALATILGWRFVDADTLHSPGNLARIGRGDALTDVDRGPWLDAVAHEIDTAVRSRTPLVVACSALRQSHRTTLRRSRLPDDSVRFIYLKVSAAGLARRLRTRVHFASPTLLASQLTTLEEPTADEADAFTVNGEQPVEHVIGSIRQTLTI
jgi:gluconokinase